MEADIIQHPENGAAKTDQAPIMRAFALARRSGTDEFALLRQIEEAVDDLVILDEATAADATSLMKLLSDRSKEIDAERDDLVRPLNEHVKTINGMHKNRTNLIDAIVRKIKDRQKKYIQIEDAKRQAEEKRRREEEEARLLAEAEKHEDANVRDAILEVASQQESPVVKTGPVAGSHGGSSSRRTVTRWKVTDFAKVPDTYKLIDEKSLNAISRDANGERNIPGIEFYEDFDVTVR